MKNFHLVKYFLAQVQSDCRTVASTYRGSQYLQCAFGVYNPASISWAKNETNTHAAPVRLLGALFSGSALAANYTPIGPVLIADVSVIQVPLPGHQ